MNNYWKTWKNPINVYLQKINITVHKNEFEIVLNIDRNKLIYIYIK